METEAIRTLISNDAVILVESGAVLVVDPHSPEVPDQLRREFLKRMRGFASAGVACCHRRDDGRVLVVLSPDEADARMIRHEFIHAAQCYADAETMREALEAVAVEGRVILSAVREVAGWPIDPNGPHRDVDWIHRAWSQITGKGDYTGKAECFDFSVMLFPLPATLEIAVRETGIDCKPGIVAALTAALVAEVFDLDPSSDLARELVAHRYEADPGPVTDALFRAAAASVTESLPTP